MTCQDVDAQFERRERDPPLHPTLNLEKFQVHVDRIGELRLPFAERPQFDDFAGLRPAEA